jgi:PAS domain S-box-containing protein
MAERTRAFDWAATALGPIEQWPDSLVVTVNAILNSRQPMFLFWGDEKRQFYNDAYRPSLGVGKHPTALGQRGEECWPETWSTVGPQIEAAMTRGQSFWFENQLIPMYRNGRLDEVYWTYSYSPVYSAAGVIEGVLVTCSETTAQIIAERERDAGMRAAATTQAQLLNVFQQAPAFFALLKGPDHVIEMVNPLYLKLLNDRDVLGKPVRIVIPEAVDQGYVSLLDQVYQTGEPFYGNGVRFNVEWTVGKPLEERILDFVYQPLREPDGSISGIIALGIDITDRVRSAAAIESSEARLRESQDRLRLAQESAKIASWDWDLATGTVIWDAGSRWAYGRPSAEIRHIDLIYPFIFPEDRERVAEDLRSAGEGRGSYKSEFRCIWPDGTIHWLAGYGQPVLSPEGKPLRVIGVNINITERKAAEAALIRNEKLAAVGRLASSIAHEINNPLESVTNLLYLANRSEDIAELRKYLNTADLELRRVSAIAAQTLRFHRQSSRPTECACAGLVSDVLGIYHSRLHNLGISVERRDRVSQPVLCFEGEIRQVVSNLVGNAMDALSGSCPAGGGCLFVRTREARNWATGAPGVVLTVADTGPGMSPETLQKIAEPFFTTKGINGTGLGLWISKDIVSRHQGTFSVRSSQSPVHPGTVFTVFLPFRAPCVDSPHRAEDPQPAFGIHLDAPSMSDARASPPP